MNNLMKRFLLPILALIMALTLLSGCDAVFDPADLTDMVDIADIADGFISGSHQMPSAHDVSDEALYTAERLVQEDGVYTTPAMVAAYIYKFNKLPSNYITKREAEKLGWKDDKKYISDAAPGKSLGGSNYGNYEGLLPKGKYRECDVNYNGGKRGSERLVYSDDGDIYYTADHYDTFTQLY